MTLTELHDTIELMAIMKLLSYKDNQEDLPPKMIADLKDTIFTDFLNFIDTQETSLVDRMSIKSYWNLFTTLND